MTTITPDTSNIEVTPTPPAPPVTNTTVGKSIGWMLLFLVVFFGVAIIYGAFLGAQLGMANPELALENPSAFEETVTLQVEEKMLAPDGIFIVGVWQFIILLPLIIWAATYKDLSWRESLAINPVAIKSVGLWSLVYCGYFVAQALINLFYESNSSEIFEQTLGSKHVGVFLFIAFLAPIIEELIFRGYLFNAWRNTRLGVTGTIMITSALFALLHGAQYELLVLGYLFVFGLILGYAREKTNSVITPIVLHIVNNVIAGVAMVYLGLS